VGAKTEEIGRRLEELSTPVADELGYELVELRYVDGYGRSTVRVFIDKEGGVSLDDCTAMSRRLSERLDLADVVPGPYDLEVSSPGVERPFTSMRQYQRCLERTVEVVLTEPLPATGRSLYLRGTLAAADESRVALRLPEGRTVEIPMDRVKRANRVVTFEPVGGVKS
jgi:ribosome maturation factor RimP